nr:hypothetical protein [Tanacetum cinerariifolium]
MNSQRLEVKNVMEQPAEHGTRIVESLQNFRVIHKSSISLNNMSQISLFHAIAPILSTKEPKYSLSMGLEEENDVYQEEEEFNLEDIQDVILREKLLSINRLIANIESLNDNPTLDCVLKSPASIPIFEEFDNSFSDNSSPEFETFSDQTEETRSDVDLFLASDNSIPSGIENFGYDLEGDIRFLKELLIDDSITFPVTDSFNFEDDPSFPRPPPEPPDLPHND